MSTATIWDRNSTNYGQNAFVKQNGTSSFEVKSQKEALDLISQAVCNESIERLDLVLETGRIIWMRKDKEPLCECGGCSECQDDLIDQYQRELDEEDDFQEFDLNDPRR